MYIVNCIPIHASMSDTASYMSDNFDSVLEMETSCFITVKYDSNHLTLIHPLLWKFKKYTKNVALGVNVSKSPQNTTQKSKDLETRTQLTPGNISVVSEGWAVPAPLMVPVILFLLSLMRWWKEVLVYDYDKPAKVWNRPVCMSDVLYFHFQSDRCDQHDH